MKMNTTSLKKLNSYSKLIKGLWYIGIVLGILIIISAVLFQTGALKDHFGLNMDYLGISIKIDSSYLNNSMFLSLHLSLFIFWALFMYILYKIKSIIENTIKNQTPFVKENINFLKHISFSFFVSAGLYILLKVVLSVFVVSNNIFDKINQIKGIEIEQVISAPEWPLIIGFLILILAEIFKHGYKLQQDSESII